MAKYVGETIRIRTTVTNVDTGAPVTPTSVKIDIWSPDASGPQIINAANMTAVTGSPGTYEYFWSTNVAYDPGPYPFKITVTGTSFTNWEFSQVILNANRR